MKNSDLLTLSQSPLFDGVSREDLPVLLNCLSPLIRDYGKEEMILHAGDAVMHVGIILQGRAKILRHDCMGKTILLLNLSPASMFGEVLCCAGIKQSPVSVVADVASRVCLLDFARIIGKCSQSCSHHQQLVRNMLSILADKNLFLNRKLDLMTLRSIRARLTAFLEEVYLRQGKPNLTVSMTREDLSQYLSVDRSALSREISRMCQEGLIQTRRKEFVILDANRLFNP